MKTALPKIAITLGDPGGIGPEVIIKALAAPSLPPAIYIVIGPESILKETSTGLGQPFNLPVIKNPKELPAHQSGQYLFTPEGLASEYIRGKMDKANGRMALAILRAAATLAVKKEVDALVTAPVSKQAINEVGEKFTGHTEFLAQASRTKEVVMTFVGAGLKVALLTTHLAYKKVPLHLTTENIISTLLICRNSLRQYFGFGSPRIAVCGLNPHAGENGIFGKEEITIIQPAIEAARVEGVNCTGSIPADTAFYRAQDGEFDLVLALYHDQGMIPFKTLYPYQGANVTLGLPFIRTSVTHGTAFDIAGKGQADARSMQDALQIANQMCRHNKGELFPS